MLESGRMSMTGAVWSEAVRVWNDAGHTLLLRGVVRMRVRMMVLVVRSRVS